MSKYINNYFFFIISCTLILGIFSASVLDFLSPRKAKEDNGRNCVCSGPSCICCVDFNVSFVDLGGPGCVRLNYMSEKNAVDMNVTYGDNLLKSGIVTAPDPVPVCLNLLSTFAQMCARFNNLILADNGLKGCLHFGPTLLGESQLQIQLGCFQMDPKGITLTERSEDFSADELDIEQENEADNFESNDSADAPQDFIGNINAEQILAVVNETANRGFALLSQWLGLRPEKNDQTNQVSENQDSSISK